MVYPGNWQNEKGNHTSVERLYEFKGRGTIGTAPLENYLALCLKLHIHILYVLTNSTLGYTLRKTNVGQSYIHKAHISTVPKSKNLDTIWKTIKGDAWPKYHRFTQWNTSRQWKSTDYNDTQ